LASGGQQDCFTESAGSVALDVDFEAAQDWARTAESPSSNKK
jgi:hypothetical protein